MKKPRCIDESETWECTAWDTGCKHNTTTKSLVDWDVHAISSHIFLPLAKQVKRNSKKIRSWPIDTPHPSIKNFNPVWVQMFFMFPSVSSSEGSGGQIGKNSRDFLKLSQPWNHIAATKKVPSKFPEILPYPLPAISHGSHHGVIPQASQYICGGSCDQWAKVGWNTEKKWSIFLDETNFIWVK